MEEKLKFGKDNFINNRSNNLKEHYEVVKQLGKGGYGKVYQVRNKKTGDLFACKKLSKLDINNLPKFEREINILMKTDTLT